MLRDAVAWPVLTGLNSSPSLLGQQTALRLWDSDGIVSISHLRVK
jgi:hypothetical protein